MSTTEVLRGILKSDGSLELEEKPTLPAGPVRVTVESLPAKSENVWTVLERIWEERKASGVTPRSREEIDAEIEQVRREWEDQQQEVERLQRESRPSKK
ncbi:MAG: hypothetical protein WBX00_31735 [Isosphaeraceae bacterium]